jgi:peroxiredoxin (alkyl hydroperoxide reductase subunit C)
MSVLVTRQAPDFTAAAVLPTGEIVDQWNLAERSKGRYTVLAFYPLDFTFVCPSELIALSRRADAFAERGADVVAISIDSQFSHWRWRNTPVEDGGIGPVKYTMVADVKHEICRAYGIEHPDAGVALRGTFLIDQSGVVRHQSVNDLPLGRDMDEYIRLLDAWQFFEKNGEVCPAGWRPGRESMKPDAAGVAAYLAANEEEL